MKQSTDTCANCALLNRTIDSGCPRDPDIPITPGSTRVFIPLGEHIYEEGAEITGVYCMGSGEVALVKEGDGTAEWVVAVISPGDVLGMPDILEGNLYRTGAIAIEDVTACLIPAQEMRELLRNNPAIMVRMLQQVCQRIRTLETRIEEHAGIPGDDGHEMV